MSFEKIKELIGKEVEVFGNKKIVSEVKEIPVSAASYHRDTMVLIHMKDGSVCNAIIVKHNGSYLDEIMA